MGNIKDIIDLMKKGPELTSKIDSNAFRTKSIARGAKDATFQFPCIVSNAVPADMASTIASTLDKMYAAFTQTWLSINSMFDITVDPTPLSYLKRIHQNMIESSNLLVDDEDVESYFEKVYDGSYRLYMTEDKSFGILFNQNDKDVNRLMLENTELLNDYMSEFDLSPITEYETYTEALTGAPTDKDVLTAAVDTLRKQNEVEDSTAKRIDRLNSSKNAISPKITNRELKRANEMVPYGLEVRLVAVNDKKEFVQYIDIVVGIKAVLHLVESEDMAENIVRALQNKDVIFKFLRWTTGEISLIKDVILNVNDLRLDATSGRNGRAPFFSMLKRLKNKHIGIKNITMPYKLIPNSTIVITSEEVEYINDNYSINLSDAKTALKLIDALFLMGILIVDDSAGIVDMILDGDTMYKTYSIDTLNRENKIAKGATIK